MWGLQPHCVLAEEHSAEAKPQSMDWHHEAFLCAEAGFEAVDYSDLAEAPAQFC